MTKMYDIQIKDSEKYKKNNYVTPRRWSSYALQVREAMLAKPKRILEIGPGNNIVTNILKGMGYDVQTLDIDNRLGVDYVGDISDQRILSQLCNKYDLLIACQIFEHIEYADFLRSLKQSKMVAPKAVISLPYTELNSKFFHLVLRIPGINNWSITKKIIYKTIKHDFNGEHYWEIGKQGFSLNKVKNDILGTGWTIDKAFLNPDNPFHFFFVLSHKSKHED